ncbi:MAG: tetratricopeptide repeat protein [Sandaracinaceae bacterium]
MRAMCTALALCFAWVPALAHAQDEDEDRAVLEPRAAQADAPRVSLMEARALAYFERGLEQLRQGDAAGGRDLLRQSLSIYPNIATRFNLAMALRRTGEVTEARHVFRALLEEPELSPRERQDITTQLAQVDQAIATLELSVHADLAAQIEVDGFAAGRVDAGRRLRVSVDPGTHSVSALSGALRGTAELEVAAGGVAIAVLRLAPLAEDGDATGLHWGLGLGATGLLAGAVAIAIAVLLAPQPSPIVDDHTGVVWIGTIGASAP